MNARLLLSLLACASACSTVNAASPPSQLPAGAAASARPPQFIAEPSLIPLAVTCRGEELPQPNGVDDDCDGAIDGQPAEGATVTLAYRRDGALRIVLQGPEGARALDASCGEASVCIARVEAGALSPGRYELRIESLAASADALPISVAVSNSGKGEVRTYLAQLVQPGETKALGTLLRE